MLRIKVIGAVFSALLLSACQNPNGSTDYGRSALLGAGVGAAAGVFGGVLNDIGQSQTRNHYGHGTGHPGPYAGPPYAGVRARRGW